jgi:ribosomal protein S18 acetylase RimI-like enzyme
VRIRAGRRSDFQALRRLWQEMSTEAAAGPYGPSSFDEYWRDAKSLLRHNLVVVAEGPDGALLGCAFAARTRKDIGHVFGLYVRPEARRRGVAKAMLKAAAAVLRENGVRWILADLELGNEEALRFYERLGFEETGRRFTIDVDGLLT